MFAKETKGKIKPKSKNIRRPKDLKAINMQTLKLELDFHLINLLYKNVPCLYHTHNFLYFKYLYIIHIVHLNHTVEM